MAERQREYVTVREAAREAERAVSTVRRWIDEGRLTRYPNSLGRVFVSRSELLFVVEPQKPTQS